MAIKQNFFLLSFSFPPHSHTLSAVLLLSGCLRAFWPFCFPPPLLRQFSDSTQRKMLGNWEENGNSWTMIENSSMPASGEVVAGGITYNNALVEGDGICDPASEDEITEMKDLLAEPESVKISMDALLYCNNEYLEKCLGTGDVLGSAHQNNHLKSYTGTMQSDIPLYHNDLVNANGVREEDLHVTGGLSSASNELILDTKYIARFSNLEYTCEGLHSVNLSLETCSPGLGGRVSDSSEALDLSAGTMNLLPESTSDQNVLLLDKLTTHELQLAYRGIFCLETTVKDRDWLFSRISLGLQNFIMENGPGFLERETSSTECEDTHLKCSNDSHGTNSSFESCSPGLSEWVADGAQALDLSAGTVNPVPVSTSDQNFLILDKLTTHELHLAYRGIFGLETTVKDRKWLLSRISLGLQNFIETENGPAFLERETSFTQREDMHLKCSDDSHGKNSSFENSPGLSERVTDGAEAINLSAATINSVPESTSDQYALLFDNMTIHELHQAFRSTFGLETAVEDRKWLISRISLGMQKFIEAEDCSIFLESRVSSAKHEDMPLRCNNDSHGNNSSKSCSSGLSERLTDGGETLDLSAGTIPVSESTSDQNGHLLDKLTTQELQYAFKSTFDLETTVEDRKWLINHILIGLQNFVEMENVSGFLEREISFTNHVDVQLRCSNDSLGTDSSFVDTKNVSGFPEREVSSTKHVDMHVRCSDDSLGTDSSFASVVGNWAKSLCSSQTEKVTSLDVYTTSHSKVNDTGFGLMSWRNGGAVKKRKRSRKPTRGFIEASDLKSRYCIEKLENRITSSKDKLNELSNQNLLNGVVDMASNCKQDTSGDSDSQVTCGRWKAKRFAKKNTSVRVHEHDPGDNKNDRSCCDPEHSSDLESSHREWQDDMSESDDGIMTVSTRKDPSRRKNHRVWTLSEVMKLIEGVSQHGVGRWTEIKRLLFPSSAHRTAVDLKDKWRNLLKASGAKLKNKRKDYIGQKGSQPIPESALKRVKELAIIHLYPRPCQSKHTSSRTSKLVNTALQSPSNHAASNSDTTVCRRGRTHRKSIT
ncbi:uncharacterized protein LOC113338303 [Papaver somniferum]|uniref:uncharacterized protein LOC113338303 n=1 Tax=Papaver somniferum TaxID=3469 RepID=UPI000E6FC2DF|nr:uncharacterized protein LOC113338303 [Papaver somniferum]